MGSTEKKARLVFDQLCTRALKRGKPIKMENHQIKRIGKKAKEGEKNGENY